MKGCVFVETKYYAIYTGNSRLGHLVEVTTGNNKGKRIHRGYKFTAEQAAAILHMNPKVRVKETKTGDIFTDREGSL